MNTDASEENNTQKPGRRLPPNLILLAIGASLVIASIIFYPAARSMMEIRPSPGPSDIALTAEGETIPIPISSPTSPTPTRTPSLDPSPTPFTFTFPSQFGTLVLSIREGADIHLFAYQPFLESVNDGIYSALPLTRITSGHQQDITPAISPDGTKIAFSSNREGSWDLYILDMISGETSKFTDTRAYDGNPSWSPDGKWLAYESYHINNLDIFIQDLDQKQGPISLTNHPAADYAPNWSGQGRRISFISTRYGKQEVWYADLNSSENDKAVPVKNLPSQSVNHPTWTTDGRYLSWSLITKEGNHSIVTWDSEHPNQDPILEGSGDWPLWAGAGEILYSLVETPYETYLTAYPGINNDLQVMMPSVKLPGPVAGFSWAGGLSLPSQLYAETQVNPTPIWNPIFLDEDSDIEKKDLINLRGLKAPYPQLNEMAVDSFVALRQETRDLLGWDFLSTLENAYVPLSEPLDPGINLDWLHTGRGFSVNDIPRLANWMVVIREDFSGQTFWRLYIRTNNQSGIQGQPLHNYVWDFNARYSGSNVNYENGGAITNSIPAGYWVDFTELAAAYGWKRFPAQPYWQYSESAARFQYFAFTQGISLQSGLLELYSPEAIQTLAGSANP